MDASSNCLEVANKFLGSVTWKKCLALPKNTDWSYLGRERSILSVVVIISTKGGGRCPNSHALYDLSGRVLAAAVHGW